MSADLLPPPGEFQTAQEVRDAHFNAELRRTRRRMLLWSLPVMLLVLAVAVKLLSAVAINAAGQSAYRNTSYGTAQSRFESLHLFNVIEPWKAHFNQGTAIYSGGDFWAAIEPLEEALDLVPTTEEGEPPGPQECDVRTNLSLAHEGLGDEATAVGDWVTAQERYALAQDVLSNCGESDGTGGEEAQEAEDRQQQSQEDAQQQQEQQEQGDGDPDDGDPNDDDPNDDDPNDDDPNDDDSNDDDSNDDDSNDGADGEESTSTDPQQEELEQRNQDAEESREADEQASGGGDGSGQNW